MTNTGTSTGGAGRRAGPRSRGICTFWLGERHFGLDVGLVGEIVTVDAPLPVPMAPAAVRGLFNLRGMPIALLDIDDVLGFGEVRADARCDTALVVRQESLVVAFAVDRMAHVVSPDRGTLTEAGPGEHPAVDYFLTLDAPRGATVTVLRTEFLLERVGALSFLKPEE